MDLPTVARLMLTYGHLLLCVFALHEVLAGDWRVLRRRLDAADVQAMHRRVVWLLAGLWISGLTMIAVDTGLDSSQLTPKLIVKIVTVLVLSANGLLLQHWCFPRLARVGTLGAAELSVVVVAGAVSTASWLMAAFLGIARTLVNVPALTLLELYGAVLLAAALAALLIAALWRRRQTGAAAAQPAQSSQPSLR